MSTSVFEHMEVLFLAAESTFNMQLRTFPLNQALPQHACWHSRCYKVSREHHWICLAGQHCDWCHLMLREVLLLLRERQLGAPVILYLHSCRFLGPLFWPPQKSVQQISL